MANNRITIRVEDSELNSLQEFMQEFKEYNRSDLFRKAIARLIEETKRGREGKEIAVNLSKKDMDIVEYLVEKGIYDDGAEAVKDAVRHYFTHKRVAELRKDAEARELIPKVCRKEELKATT